MLEVGGSATVASGTPPRNATSETLSPRRVASSSNSNTTPFTFSTIRSACTDQLLSTTKQTAKGERCSRTLRRRSSPRISIGPPRAAAARSVASSARSTSPGRASLWREYFPRRRPVNDRARRPVRARSMRSTRRRCSNTPAGSTAISSTAGFPSGAAPSSVTTSPDPPLFFGSPRSRARPRAAVGGRRCRPRRRGRTGRLSMRCPSASAAAARMSSELTSSRPSSTAAARAHSTIAMSARWLCTPEPSTTRATAP